MKVIHLPYGIGMSALAQALREKGVDAESACLRTNRYAYLADQRLNFDQYPEEEAEKLRTKFFNEAMEKYDVFHFHFGETFFPDRHDLEILKEKGKKIVVHHRGSEVRMLSQAKKLNNPYVRVKPAWPEEKVRSNLEFLSKYFDRAIVNDEELKVYVEPYYKNIHVVPHAIDIHAVTTYYPDKQAKPLIVHAPSRRDTKGTRYVLNAIELLKQTGLDFDFQLIEGLSHQKALALYQKATIVIDQLQIGTYGHLSIEAMAMGKPVVCYIREDLLKKYPDDLPIVNANPKTLSKVLKKLISQPKSWKAIRKQGRQYVKNYHSYDKVADQLIKVYNEL